MDEEGGPFMVVRLQPISGGLCRFSYTTTIGDDEVERSVVATADVNEKIVTTSNVE
jgi:hypothetical protein